MRIHRGMQVGDASSPFTRHDIFVAAVRMQMKGSPLWHQRKVTPLTKGQIGNIVKNMHVGGFEMLQVGPADPLPGLPSLSMAACASVNGTG